MKKFAVPVIVLILVFSITANAEEQTQVEEKTNAQILQEAVSIYREEKNEENLHKALEMIDKLIEEDYQKGYLIGIKSYLYSLQSDELLAQSKENLEDMAFGQKFFLGNLYLDRNDYLTAIEIYDKINEGPNTTTCVWRHKGEAHYKLEDYEKAEQALEKAIELKEDHTDAYLWMALTQIRKKDYEKALSAIDKGISLFEKDIPGCEDEQIYEYYELKGDILVKLEKKEEAVEIYKKILDIHSDKEKIQNKISVLE